MMEHTIITINTSNTQKPVGDNIYEARCSTVDCRTKNDTAIATLCVQAFNRLDKTKACIESILKYTNDIAYKLLLVDSGSSDGTLEYFKSVPHDNVTILRLSQNVNACFPQGYFFSHMEGRYYVQVNNDLIVTKNWLSNLIKCAQSDIRIGMVNPVSSNVSNLQQVNLEYKTDAEMHKKAEEYNKSNPLLWQERIRLITLGTLYTRECIEAIGGLADTGFLHDFSDDDLSFRVRRAGYKLILAKDTWIHHNHDFRNLEDKSAEDFQKSIDSGRQNFSDKYFGIDSWTDAINYETELASYAIVREKAVGVAVLGIDCRCGEPLLDLKNTLRDHGAGEIILSAFEQDAKYFIDLKSICDGFVACDREEFVTNHFAEKQFDYIIIGRPLNEYHEPYKLLQDIARLARNKAQILFKVANAFSYKSLKYMQSADASCINSYPLALPLEVVFHWLESIGCKNGNAAPHFVFSSEAEQKEYMAMADKFCKAFSCEDTKARLLASEYHISVHYLE